MPEIEIYPLFPAIHVASGKKALVNAKMLADPASGYAPDGPDPVLLDPHDPATGGDGGGQ